MKNLLLLVFLFSSTVAFAQPNFQLLYDTDREHFTSTFEMFKPDKWGNTFMFIDFDYNNDNGVSGAYYEITRAIKTKKMPFGVRVEYNGGVANFGGNGVSFNQAWLFGPTHSWTKDFKKYGMTASILYKGIKNAEKANVQFTYVWYVNFAKGKLKFNGFFDYWTNNFEGRDNVNILLTEPQLWYNVSDNLSIGGELEISSNFAGADGFKFRPALGAKWNFK